MSRRPLIHSVALALAGAALVVAPAAVAQNQTTAPTPDPSEIHNFQGEHHTLPDVDNRTGQVPPPTGLKTRNAGQEIRWNSLGTPAIVNAAEPLASGLNADPEQAAREYLTQNESLFGLTAEAVQALERVAVNPLGDGAAVLLRQRFGDLPAGADGLVAVGVNQGKVHFVTSTLSRDTSAPPAARLTEQQALQAAATDAGIDLAKATVKLAKPVAVPSPSGVLSAYQVVLAEGVRSGEPVAVTTHVDAVTGAVILRENLVDHADDPEQARWKVFPADPPDDFSSTDNRVTWCFKPGPDCDAVIGGDPATGKAWDVDHLTGTPTGTSVGNAARTYEKRSSPDPFAVGTRSGAPVGDRDHDFPWTNAWYNAKCDPATLDAPGEADLEAAISNLHAMHNRMHDWSYRLGFTETAWNMQSDNGTRGGLGNDPELGNAQAGARDATIRNNANQITYPDGIAPITNMYLWQPTAGSFYVPCVDGDYDMSVIGHEYTHAISGRMIAGPNSGWSGSQAGAMNESTSDLFAMEYLWEYGYRPRGDSPYVTGGYVTGDKVAGIRNYDMSKSPLNYSDIAYDVVGQQVHADGEIWTATQFDLRQAFVKRYGQGSKTVQRKCADGRLPLTKCPGNRRWVQLSFDALLLMASGAVSYVDHRDALLAADTIRFAGANRDLIWQTFARRGLGAGASSNGPNDPDPKPSFVNQVDLNGRLTLKPTGDAEGAAVRLYIGDYEGRVVPVADTDPATPLGDTVELAEGHYKLLVVGAGFGHKRLEWHSRSGVDRTLSVRLYRNHASAAGGAVATGDGVNQARLIDETETTNWASLTGPAAGRTVTVDLAGDGAVKVRRVQVSSMLRPNINDPADPGGQNRYSALRKFQVLACDATGGQDCASDAGYSVIYTSADNAFDGRFPRPRGADMIIKSFDVRDANATHLRLRVLTTQCTGNPRYAGEQDNDPRAATDCATASPLAGQVRAAEFQAFSR
ncbi:M36 family metallopeptidase [Rhizohabitans arisaemae]|uniref:M36 family metallopeptidase n=1 Tax=Rhizohabitans arisaemae TaxID=2720610 RepID=UPI0024B212DC|nr:M36 family metallopeptidase [Rhizohabitans arisaemae]